jgi:hypothetical protein
VTGARVNRRRFLAASGVAGALAASGIAARPSAAQSPQPPIILRSEWGADLPPRGQLPAEDVRFLLVHHTYQPDSSYEEDEVAGMLRSIYGFHTGASKGWPDIAYNFFVDKFGRIWEGRTGSVDGPVQGSATGGNQGYSQLCCFLGDTTTEPPTPPALDSMISLLAWLADRYGIDTSPGAQVSFTSRGSNKWPAGAAVSTATIAGHRDMSMTECPGDACYQLVTGSFASLVTDRRASTAATSTTTTSAVPTTSTVVTTPPAANTTSAERADELASSGTQASEADNGSPPSDGTKVPAIAAGLVAVTAGAAVAIAYRRRQQPPSPSDLTLHSDADPTTIEFGSEQRAGGGAAWFIDRAWGTPAVDAAVSQIRSAAAVDPDRWLDAPEPHWKALATALWQVDPTSSRDAAGIAVVQWHRDVLAVLLLGSATGTASGPDAIELHSRRLNLVELPEGGVHGTFSFGRLDPELVRTSWELGPADRTSSLPPTAALGGQN